MTQNWLLAFYCLLILLASLAGGWLPILVQLTHRRMQLALSLIGGFMLGVGLLHLMPHALMDASAEHVALGMLAGFLVMFFLERFFSFHHHDVAETDTPINIVDPTAPDADAHDGHAHELVHSDHQMIWGGAAVGLTLHSIIGGVALGASMASESYLHEHGGWPGLAVFLVIILHKPFDSLTLGTLMAAGGYRRAARHAVNALFAMAVPLGAALFLLGVRAADAHTGQIVGTALAFSAGVFLCIAMSDVLPELQFHHHDRLPLSVALLAGLALAWAVFYFESKTHEHHHDDEGGQRHVVTGQLVGKRRQALLDNQVERGLFAQRSPSNLNRVSVIECKLGSTTYGKGITYSANSCALPAKKPWSS